jgi:hypothetical protein
MSLPSGDSQVLLERVQRLEKRLHVFTVAGSMVLVLVVAYFVVVAVETQRPQPDVLAIRDADCRVRAELAIVEGEPKLLFYDTTGVPHTVIGADANGPGMVLGDSSGKIRLNLRLARDGSPHVALYGPDGRDRISLHAGPELAELRIHDVDEKPRAALAINAEGLSMLGLYDSAGKERVALSVKLDGTPGISLFDEQGHAIWSPR